MRRIKGQDPGEVKPHGGGIALDSGQTFELALAELRPGGRAPEGAAVERAVRMGALLGAVLGEPVAPVRIGPWILECPVGSGGMGAVYRARHEQTGVVGALKLLHSDLRGARPRFLREATLLRRIVHPRVVRYLDHGETETGQAWLVMAWLEGEDLAQRLRQGPLPLRDALTLVMEAAAGLSALHRAGVIHRDVKPANLFLARGHLDGVCVVDLGIAMEECEVDARLTTTGAVLGTPHYMAPEQVQGHATPRTDVYALGVCLYECLAGQLPFRGDTPGAVLQQVLMAPPPSLAAQRPGMWPSVDVLVGRMLAKDPSIRPQDMDAVALSLAELLSAGASTGVLSRAESGGQATSSDRVPAARPEMGGTPGRARERGRARGLIEAAFEEQQAVIVALTGPPGVGRSALLRALAALDLPARRLVARCAPGESGEPYALLRRLVGPSHPGMEARVGPWDDPRRVADRVRLAWLDQVESWASTPTVLFLDDLHLADLSSQHLLGLALRRHGRAPLALVFSAPSAALPALGELPVEVEEIALAPLSEDLRRRLGLDLPGSFDRLPADLAPELRRLVRAVALVGRPAPIEAVAMLLEVSPASTELRQDLHLLERRGLLRARSEGVGPAAASAAHELEFASERAWSAAFDSCTEEDRLRASSALADWLKGRGRPAERARHLARLGRQREASASWLEAAWQAMAGEDPSLAQAHLLAAEEADPSGPRGEIERIRAQLLFWQGRVDQAGQAAVRALDALPPGSPAWMSAAGQAITALGQSGDHGAMMQVVERVRNAPAAVGEDLRIVAMCRAISQIALREGVEDPRLPSLVEAASAPAGDYEARAWQARVRSSMASTRSFDEAIGAVVEAHRAHVLSGDPRAACLTRLFMGSWYVWTGSWERAEQAIDEALWTAGRLEATYLQVWGRYVLGKLMVETADPERAEAHLVQVAAEAIGSPRIAAGAQLYASLAALRAGRAEVAARLAEQAALHPAVVAGARAAAFLAALVQGDPEAAAARMQVPDEHRRLVEWDELVWLGLARSAPWRGEDPATVGAEAVRRVLARADTLADPLRRNDYLARPHLVRRTMELAASSG